MDPTFSQYLHLAPSRVKGCPLNSGLPNAAIPTNLEISNQTKLVISSLVCRSHKSWPQAQSFFFTSSFLLFQVPSIWSKKLGHERVFRFSYGYTHQSHLLCLFSVELYFPLKTADLYTAPNSRYAVDC